MVFGHMNAGTELSAVLSKMINMDPALADDMANFADDFLGGSSTIPTLFDLTRAFFQACRKNDITLKPKKTRIGYNSAQFVGYVIADGRVRVADDNLKPIRSVAAPRDKSEVRRVLGLFNMSSRFIPYPPGYSLLVSPLSRLTGKVPWEWRDNVEGVAFRKAKEAVLANPGLDVPDFEIPVRIRPDASDFGMGAICFQREDQKNPPFLQPLQDLAEDPNVRVLGYASSKFDRAMLVRPIYYKEARAVFWSLKKFEIILIQSPHTVLIETDHMPLRWVKKLNEEWCVRG